MLNYCTSYLYFVTSLKNVVVYICDRCSVFHALLLSNVLFDFQHLPDAVEQESIQDQGCFSSEVPLNNCENCN